MTSNIWAAPVARASVTRMSIVYGAFDVIQERYKADPLESPRIVRAGERYLAGLADMLRGLGVPGVPLVMRSRGGIVSAGLAARQPVTLFLSGPAAGAQAGSR